MTEREQTFDAGARLLYEGNRNVRIAERRDHLESSRHQIAELEHEESCESIKVVSAKVSNLIVVGCNKTRKAEPAEIREPSLKLHSLTNRYSGLVLRHPAHDDARTDWKCSAPDPRNQLLSHRIQNTPGLRQRDRAESFLAALRTVDTGQNLRR